MVPLIHMEQRAVSIPSGKERHPPMLDSQQIPNLGQSLVGSLAIFWVRGLLD